MRLLGTAPCHLNGSPARYGPVLASLLITRLAGIGPLTTVACFRSSLSYHTFIGDRRTKHPIRALRSPVHPIVIPKDAILHNVRTSLEQGYQFPAAMTEAARKNPSLHIFEYQGETLYMHFVHGLIEATTAVKSE